MKHAVALKWLSSFFMSRPMYQNSYGKAQIQHHYNVDKDLP
jgi:hypothetical protein